MQDAQAANLHADSGGAERTPWRAYCTPASFLVAASMSCSCGSASCSRLDAYGIGISAPVTRTTGASSSSNASSMMSDMISLATPDCGQPSSTTIARCVFLTDATIAARSSGLMLLKLSTSQSMPCAASFSATYTQWQRVASVAGSEGGGGREAVVGGIGGHLGAVRETSTCPGWGRWRWQAAGDGCTSAMGGRDNDNDKNNEFNEMQDWRMCRPLVI
eukprot:363952-Chlamydomonas_euryale.AAC.10